MAATNDSGGHIIYVIHAFNWEGHMSHGFDNREIATMILNLWELNQRSSFDSADGQVMDGNFHGHVGNGYRHSDYSCCILGQRESGDESYCILRMRRMQARIAEGQCGGYYWVAFLNPIANAAQSAGEDD